MIRATAFLMLLAAGACGKSPDPAATASARDIDAAAKKAIDDTDAAYRDAAARPAAPVGPEQTPR